MDDVTGSSSRRDVLRITSHLYIESSRSFVGTVPETVLRPRDIVQQYASDGVIPWYSSADACGRIRWIDGALHRSVQSRKISCHGRRQLTLSLEQEQPASSKTFMHYFCLFFFL